MSRTNGIPHDCRGCRFWSEMIARSDDGTVKALCINMASPSRAKYVSGRHSCTEWASGHLGAVDEPGTNGTQYEDEDEA